MIVLIFVVGKAYFNNSIDVRAASINKSYSKTFVFTDNELAVCSVVVNINYKEYYNLTNNNKKSFYKRDCTFTYKSYDSTISADAYIDFIVHQNSSGTTVKSFPLSKWKSNPTALPGGLTGFWAKTNGDIVNYSINTTNKAVVAISAYCSGTYIPTRVGKLLMDL